MEEAEVLADRIALIYKQNSGAVSCFFQNQDTEYYLTMIRNQEALKKITKIESFV